METRYDPRMDFYRKGIDFLFRQTPAIVISLLACAVLWQEMSRRDTAHQVRLDALNTEWSKALDTARQDWRMCEEKREQLAVKVAELTTKISRMEKRR